MNMNFLLCMGNVYEVCNKIFPTLKPGETSLEVSERYIYINCPIISTMSPKTYVSKYFSVANFSEIGFQVVI